MKDFTIEMEWEKKCKGSVVVTAKTKAEAISIIKERKNTYTQIAENESRDYTSSVEILKCSCSKEYNHTITEVEYTSVWDGGHEISTKAMYNKTTGEVTNIQKTSIDESNWIENLDTEFITIDNVKFHIFTDEISGKSVTIIYILNLIEKAQSIYGDEHVEIITDEPEFYINVHTKHDSFRYEDSLFTSASNEAFNYLLEACSENDICVEEK